MEGNNVNNEIGRGKGEGKDKAEVDENVKGMELEEMQKRKKEKEERCLYIMEIPPENEGELVMYKANEICVVNAVDIEKRLVPEFSRMKLKRALVIEGEEETMGKRFKIDNNGNEDGVIEDSK